MGNSPKSIDDINPARVPCDSLDVETEFGLMHVDTYDMEAAKRYRVERAQSAGVAETKLSPTQNAQHSG